MSSPWPSPRPPVQVRVRGEFAAHREHVAAGARLLTSPAGWRQWLTLAATHRGFTATNLLAVLAVRPDATAVASADLWRQRGRQILPGQRNHPIPMLGGQGQRDAVSYVWDVSQTDGQPWVPQRRRVDPERVAAGVEEMLLARGYQLRSGRSMLIRPEVRQVFLPAAGGLARVADLGHVLTHLMLHPGVTHAPDAAPCTGDVHVEAVTASWLIATRAGLETGVPPAPAAQLWRSHRDPAGAARAAAGRAAGVAENVGRELASPRRPDLLTPRTQASAVAARSLATRAEALAARVTVPPGRPVAIPAPAAEVDLRARAQQAVTAAAAWYRDMLFHQPAGALARHTLARRGLDHVVRSDPRWAIGYAPPDPGLLRAQLRQLGFTDEELLAAGLIRIGADGRVTDLFRDRILCGVRDSGGQIVGFVGRATDRLTARHPRAPKYLNSPGTSVLFDKSRLLIGLAENAGVLAAGARPVLVEGFMDVLAVAATNETGRDGAPMIPAVAPSGTAFTADQAAALLAACPHHPTVIVAFDPDEAGLNAAARAYDLLYDATADLLRPVLPRDPAEILEHDGPDHLRGLLTNKDLLAPLVSTVIDRRLAPYFDPQFADRLQFWETRYAAATQVAPLLAGEYPRAAALISSLCERLNLETFAVTNLMLNALSSNQDGLLRRLQARGQPPSPPPPPPPVADQTKAHALSFSAPVHTAAPTGGAVPEPHTPPPPTGQDRGRTR